MAAKTRKPVRNTAQNKTSMPVEEKAVPKTTYYHITLITVMFSGRTVYKTVLSALDPISYLAYNKTVQPGRSESHIGYSRKLTSEEAVAFKRYLEND